jgi:hypothetical protein
MCELHGGSPDNLEVSPFAPTSGPLAPPVDRPRQPAAVS